MYSVLKSALLGNKLQGTNSVLGFHGLIPGFRKLQKFVFHFKGVEMYSGMD